MKIKMNYSSLVKNCLLNIFIVLILFASCASYSNHPQRAKNFKTTNNSIETKIVNTDSESKVMKPPRTPNQVTSNKSEVPESLRPLIHMTSIEDVYSHIGRNYNSTLKKKKNEEIVDAKLFNYDKKSRIYSEWIGEVRGVYAHGFGVGVFENGTVYIGYANEGMYQGYGKLFIPLYDKGVIAKIKGVRSTCVRSMMVEGEFKDSKLNGEGVKRTFVRGSTFIDNGSTHFRQYFVLMGEFVNNSVKGKAIGKNTNSESLDMFASATYECENIGGQARCETDDVLDVNYWKRQFAQAIPLAIVGAAIYSGIDTWRDEFSQTDFSFEKATLKGAFIKATTESIEGSSSKSSYEKLLGDKIRELDYTECVLSIKYNRRSFVGVSGTKKHPIYKVKCGSGKTSDLVHILKDDGTSSAGFYNSTSTFRTYLGKDKDRAAEKICECE